MKKTTLAKLLGLSCAVCLVGGAVTVGNVNTVSANEASTLVADAEWLDPWGCGAQMQYDTATGTSYLTMAAYGQRAYNVNKVKLDGLKVTMASKQTAAGPRIGFGFTNDTTNKYTLSELTTVNVTWVPYQYGQHRLYVNSNHADGTICYSDQALTNGNNPFGLAPSFVATATEESAYSFAFALVVDNEGTDTDVWSVTIDIVNGTKFDGQATPCTVYFSGAKMPGVLDENGECYVSAWGMDNSSPVSLKLEDDNQRAYVATTLPAADAAVTEYITAATEASDLAGFKAAMEKKGALETAIAALRGNDKAGYNAKLAEGNAIIEGKQDTLKSIVLAEYDKVATATAVLEDESAITADSIAAAKAALDAANAVYAEAESLLSNENKTYFSDLASDYAYEIDYAKACLIVIACENKVVGLEELAQTELLAVIAEVRTTYANYEGSEMQGLINALNETDKAAMEARLTAVVTAAEEAATALKADVQANYDAVKTAVEALEAEASEVNVAAAKAALEAADAQYEAVKELFNEEEQSAYASASLDYSARIATVEEELNNVPDDSSSDEKPADSSSDEKPADSSNNEKPADSSNNENSEENAEATSGCASTVGGISAMITLVAMAAMVVMKKKD